MKTLATLLMGSILLGGIAEAASSAVAKKRQEMQLDEPKIRVAVTKDISAALLEAKGPYRVQVADTKVSLSSGSTGKRFVVQPISDGLRWGEEYPDVYQIEVIPLAPETKMYVNGIQYKGKILVYSNGAGEMCIVNEVPIEDYLKSTLASQYSCCLSSEAMASRVIACRTAAYAASLSNKDKLWDVDASQTKYYGYGVTRQKNGIDEAVDGTRFIVLMKEDVPVLNVALSNEQAEELAAKGMDAKKILKSICPGGGLKATVEAKPVVKLK